MRMNYPSEVLRGLQAFGLDEKEVSVYLAGLEIGSASVLELSRRTKLPRTTLYPVLERLTREGIFRVGKEKKTTVYVAETPEALDQKMKEREQMFTRSIPALQLLSHTASDGPGVTFYEGSEGFKRLWKQIYASGVKEYRLITSGVGLRDYVHETYLTSRVIGERLKRGIRSRQLIPMSREAKKIVEKDAAQLRASRFLPESTKLPSTVIIFGEQVAFITTRRENTMIIVASGDVALTYNTLFDLLWDKADRP